MIFIEPLWIRRCPCLNPLFSVNPLPLAPLLHCLSARRPWEEGEQMLDEGSRGDAGVHADHHVLSLNSLLLSLGHHNSMAALPAHWSPAPPTKLSRADHPDRPRHILPLCFVCFGVFFFFTVFTCPRVQPSRTPSHSTYTFYYKTVGFETT